MRAFAVTSLFFLLTSGAVVAGEGQIEIGPTSVFPIVISQAGSYLLTADLAVDPAALSGIEIQADHVTLDLGGHVISGSHAYVSAYGGVVSTNGHGGIVVRNGAIRNFGTCLGLAGVPEIANAVEDVQVSFCKEGMTLHNTVATRATASHCNDRGLWGSHGTSFSFSSATSSNMAFVLEQGSSCFACSAYGNTNLGFHLAEATCTNCTASFNATYGFFIPNSGNLLVSCYASSNTSGSVYGSCSTGNACLNSYLP